jgi:hypothetical protein
VLFVLILEVDYYVWSAGTTVDDKLWNFMVPNRFNTILDSFNTDFVKVHNIRIIWICGLCPSFRILTNKNTQCFEKIDLFPSSGEVHKHSDSECQTPSSEPFRFYFITRYFCVVRGSHSVSQQSNCMIKPFQLSPTAFLIYSQLLNKSGAIVLVTGDIYR